MKNIQSALNTCPAYFILTRRTNSYRTTLKYEHVYLFQLHGVYVKCLLRAYQPLSGTLLAHEVMLLEANEKCNKKTYSAHSSRWFLIAWYRYLRTSFGKFSPSFSSARLSINSAQVIFRPIFWPCKSVFSSIIAQVNVCTASENMRKGGGGTISHSINDDGV